MTNRRPWPNEARHDRDEAAERLNYIIRNARALRKLVTKGQFTREDILYFTSLILDDAQTGVRYLERQGAQTIPQAREENGN